MSADSAPAEPRTGLGLGPDAVITPEWPASASVGALMTTRHGGVSGGPWQSLNLGLHSGDDPTAVASNRARLAQLTGATHVYLNQVHGTGVIELDARSAGTPTADAVWTRVPGIACTVMVADCLPVLLAAPHGRAVGAAHAGWRGLSAGVIERCAEAVCTGAACAPHELMAWLGPCIGPHAFEVGADVLAAFGATISAPHPCFMPRRQGDGRPSPHADGQPRWLADLAGLARRRLAALGVRHIDGGAWCTVADAARFYSYRRDGVTGRMAACIWIRAT